MKQKLSTQDRKDLKLMTQAIEKDPEYVLVRKGSRVETDYRHFKKVRCRVVKLAVRSIYPDYKICVYQETGTAHNWVKVKIVLSRKPASKPDSPIFNDLTEEIKHRTNRLLDKLPIAYSTYLTDFGKNDYYAPCVSTYCQAFEFKK